jgi:molybdate transport system substrate-binding protein
MIALLACLVLCHAPPRAELTVLAASSLRAPITVIVRRFEADNPGLTVQASFAGSQQLAAQIMLGAPADVFLSADRQQVDKLQTAGKVDSRQVSAFATNRLELLVSRSSAARIKGLRDLGIPGLSLCIAGETVPAGFYTREVLDRAAEDLGSAWRRQVEKNIVSLENNVSKVVTRVELGEADAGLVYQTDSRLTKNAVARTLPPAWNVSAAYFAAVPHDSPNAEAAHRFVGSVLSNKGQAILAKYGFGPAK